VDIGRDKTNQAITKAIKKPAEGRTHEGLSQEEDVRYGNNLRGEQERGFARGLTK